MKNNKCNVVFGCCHTDDDKCAYFVKHEEYEYCRYFDYHFDLCNSRVAHVNRMTLLLRELTKGGV